MRDRDRVSWLAVLACLAAQAAPALAQPAAPAGGMAVVDLVKVFNECDQVRDLNDVFRQNRQQLADEAALKRKALDELEIKMRAVPPSSPDFASFKRAFTDESIRVKVWMETKQQEVQADEFRWMEHMYEQSCDAIARMSQQRGLALVVLSEPFSASAVQDDLPSLQKQIRARKVLYCAPQIDMTAAVIQELNRLYRDAGGRGSLMRGASGAPTGMSPSSQPAAFQPSGARPSGGGRP